MKIKVLKKEVADKIAAGEVVERPVSIVKELVENAIDAGAGTIIVEIRNGGKTLIRVTDDGCGIPADQTGIAFLRHATSKIDQAEDLHHLDTLAFRGEALASISAVSRVEMITKTKAEQTGTRLLLEGGETVSSEPVGSPDGTTLIVRDLFYNTPARAKFLKSDSGESAMVRRLVMQAALAWPSIRFHMINNGNILFATRGNGNRLQAISAAVGAEHLKGLVQVTGQTKGMQIQGFVSGPGISRASRRYQSMFVNGRVVESRVMEKGLDLAFSDRLFEGRYPESYLFLTIDPAILDVNIHPNKRQVRFDDDVAVTAFLRNAVTAALATPEAIPSMERNQKRNVQKEPERTLHQNPVSKEGVSSSANSLSSSPDPPLHAGRMSSETVSAPVTDTDTTDATPEQILKKYHRERAIQTRMAEKQEQYTVKQEQPDSFTRRPFSFEGLKISGTLFHTYIVTYRGENCYLFDQHAAHERVNYERILDQMEHFDGAGQIMMHPRMIDAPFPDPEWTLPLNGIGYRIEAFGPGRWIVKEIPAYLSALEAEAFLNEFIDTVEEGEDWHSHTLMEKAAMKACKASVKAHDILNLEEIKQLLHDLSQCRSPFSCPHGRPTFIKISQKELEKRFQRT